MWVLTDSWCTQLLDIPFWFFYKAKQKIAPAFTLVYSLVAVLPFSVHCTTLYFCTFSIEATLTLHVPVEHMMILMHNLPKLLCVIYFLHEWEGWMCIHRYLFIMNIFIHLSFWRVFLRNQVIFRNRIMFLVKNFEFNWWIFLDCYWSSFIIFFCLNWFSFIKVTCSMLHNFYICLN